MIIAHIIGGLGNQMFQYAMARAVATTLQVSLRVDLVDFKGYKLHHGYELERVFGVGCKEVTPQDLDSIGLGLPRWVIRLLCKRRLLWVRNQGKYNIVVEPHFHYWPGAAEIRDDAYIFGFWQSGKYFANVEQVIRNDFKFRLPLIGNNARTLDAIRSCNAISLHLRRGDYVGNSETLAKHGLCSLQYYQNAVDYMCERVSSPEFFVFSDDLAWARSHLKFPFPTHFIGNNVGTESYRDMQLMGWCRHHIISNSSFSWWGAWLGADPTKIVVAPTKWYATPRLDTRDIFHDTWIRL